MKLYRVTLTIEVEAEDEDDALKQAMRCDDSAIISSYYELEDYDNASNSNDQQVPDSGRGVAEINPHSAATAEVG